MPAFANMAEYLKQVESSTQVLSRMASDSSEPKLTHDLALMTDRLSTSLSSLQAVSLRLLPSDLPAHT